MTDCLLPDNCEVWKPIVSLNGEYEVSSFKNFRKYGCSDILPHRHGGRGSSGYNSVCIKIIFNGSLCQRSVNKLFYEMFPEHMPKNKCNNCYNVFGSPSYSVKRKLINYCSEKCRKEFYQKDKDRRALSKAMEKKSKTRCISCDGPMPQIYGSKRMTCSQECHYKRSRIYRSNHSLKVRMGLPPGRSLKKRMEYYGQEFKKIDPIDIFNRDNWTCHVCNKKLDKSKRGTRGKDAVEIDHVIPISKGGLHTEDNLKWIVRDF